MRKPIETTEPTQKRSVLQTIVLLLPLIIMAILINGTLLFLWALNEAFSMTSHHDIGGYIVAASCISSIYIIIFLKKDIAIKYIVQIIVGIVLCIFLSMLFR